MSKNSESKDKSLEALDFIINVMKDHEKVLDQSINTLATVTEQMGVMDVLNVKVDKVEEEINSLQKEIVNLVGYLSTTPKEPLSSKAGGRDSQVQAINASQSAIVSVGSLVVFRCAQWEDFQVLAANAQMLSYSYKEAEKAFQIQAFKGNQIITYAGALPNFAKIIKTWLSNRFETKEQNIFEGF